MIAAITEDAVFYKRAMGRIYKLILILGVALAVFTVAWKGWGNGLGLALGVAGSYVNFKFLHRLAEAIGPGAQPMGKWVGIFFVTRYMLLGGACYVIFRVFGLNLVPVVIGLSMPALALLFEVSYELCLWDTKNSG